MTVKQKLLALVQQLPDDISFDDAIERFDVLLRIEQGIAQADRGEVVGHDEVMRQLLDEYDSE